MKVREYIRQREIVIQRVERTFAIRMRRALIKTVEPVIEAFKYSDSPDVEAIIKTNHIEEALRWVYIKFGYRQARWFNSNFEFQKKNDTWLRNMEGWFETEGFVKIVSIAKTTKDLLKPVVRRMAQEGLSIDKIAREIKNSSAVSIGRATTIARTEVVGAANVATHMVAKEIGDNLEKRWVTGGLKIRDSHYAAEDIGWIPFNEPFLVPNNSGGYDEMQHPHDITGSPENIINCKCVEVYRTIV